MNIFDDNIVIYIGDIDDEVKLKLLTFYHYFLSDNIMVIKKSKSSEDFIKQNHTNQFVSIDDVNWGED